MGIGRISILDLENNIPETHRCLPPLLSQVRRYVMEDRFCAIRAAIGTAQPRDVVVIAGKGHQDFQEYGDGEGGVIKVCTLARLTIRGQNVGCSWRCQMPLDVIDMGGLVDRI